AQTSPQKIALITDERLLTYREMDVEAQALAEAMQGSDFLIQRGMHIAILGGSTIETVLILFALIRIGAVLVPVNTRLTAEELRYQLVQVTCDLLLVDELSFGSLAKEINAPGTRMIAYSNLFTSERAPVEARYEVDLAAPLAIIFTSGTSGRPKGAVLTAGNFYTSAMASAYHLGHQPEDRWLCVLPLYHVGGLSIIMRAVLYGITVDLLPRFDLDEVNQVLDTQPITLISLVPTMLHRLLETRTDWPESLRLILLGGAAATPELLARCRAMNLPVATTYGLTEAASQVATMRPDDVARKPGSVGEPLLFTNIRIVNKDGEPAEPGEYGEIVVSGPTVMQGYYNDPDATARTLQNGELHTGDIGYLDEDSDLWVVQRRSDLIITGGENVYPAEVEQVLRQHPSVADVCVVGLRDADWGQRVAAAVVLEVGVTLTEDELLAFGRSHLAGYKLPRTFRFVKALPQTASGKIQRAAVKALLAGEV
ncbi:MAG: o-succinylbenzoate--CoA ligase, partial [Anaerolineae bacterium]|nr:o-succinylbenzoate--CoA ligase [Anaerolineae bacterium]